MTEVKKRSHRKRSASPVPDPINLGLVNDDLCRQHRQGESDWVKQEQVKLHEKIEQLKASVFSLTRDVARETRRSGAATRGREAAEAALVTSKVLNATLSTELVERRAREEELKEELSEATSKVKALDTKLTVRDKMVSRRDEKLKDAASSALAEQTQADSKLDAARSTSAVSSAALARSTSAAHELSAARLTIIRRMAARGPRAVVNRTDEQLSECNGSAASTCKGRMTGRLSAALGEVGGDDEVSTSSLVDAIRLGGYDERVWESRHFWDKRMAWLREVSSELQLVWTPRLTLRMKDKLNISQDKVDELRFSLSHHRVGQLLKPRPWVINPHTGERVNFPQPVAPRSRWTPILKENQERYGLKMDAAGRVAQRSYTDVLRKQFARDSARGLLQPISEESPIMSVLGADGTGIGARSMMHVANSIAPTCVPQKHITPPPPSLTPYPSTTLLTPRMAASPLLRYPEGIANSYVSYRTNFYRIGQRLSTLTLLLLRVHQVPRRHLQSERDEPQYHRHLRHRRSLEWARRDIVRGLLLGQDRHPRQRLNLGGDQRPQRQQGPANRRWASTVRHARLI